MIPCVIIHTPNEFTVSLPSVPRVDDTILVPRSWRLPEGRRFARVSNVVWELDLIRPRVLVYVA